MFGGDSTITKYTALGGCLVWLVSIYVIGKKFEDKEKDWVMFGDMMDKLQEMKQQTEKIKKRLDSISVDGDAEGGMVKVVVTANKKVTSITISNELMAEGDKEQIEDLTMIALNKALAKAEDVSDAEMAGAAKGFLPGMGL